MNDGYNGDSMSDSPDKKQQFLQKIVEYILINGLSQTGIRTLAKAAGTSDRMLIYYFGSKNELLDQSFKAISGQFSTQLDAMMGTHKRSADQLLEELSTQALFDVMKPGVQLAFELIGLAARGEEPYASNAREIAEIWMAWITSKLENPDPMVARDVYAHFEGRLLVKLVLGE